MKKYFFILFFLIISCDVVWSAAPNKPYTFTSGTIISSANVNSDFDTAYSYLQSGVSVYAANSINQAAIATNVIFQYSNLNLTGGIVNADIATGAGIRYEKLNLNAGIKNTDIISLATSKLTTSTGAIGDILYYNGTIWTNLPAGNNGQVLQTRGSTLPPQWANASNVQYFSSSGTFATPSTVSRIYVTMCGGGGGGGGGSDVSSAGGGGSGGQCIVNYPLAVTGGANYTVTVGTGGSGGADQNSDGVNGTTSGIFNISVLGGNKGIKGSGTGAGGAAVITLDGNTSGVGGSTGVLSGAGGTRNGAGDPGGGGGGTILGSGGTGGTAADGTAGASNTGAGGGGGGKKVGGGVGGTGGSGVVIVAY